MQELVSAFSLDPARKALYDYVSSRTPITFERSTTEGWGMPGRHHMEGMPNLDAAQHAQHSHVWGRHSTSLTGANAFLAIDRMVAAVQPLRLPNPVLISPPEHTAGNWTAKSDTRDRPLRVDLVLNPMTGVIISRSDFRSKPWLDRVIGVGIAAHEGQLFGFANQLVSLFTTVGLFTLSVSGVVMWWRRKPEGVVGAPTPTQRVRFSAGLVTAMVALGLYFPFLGGSMIFVGLTEKFVLRRLPKARLWLGLPTLS